MDNIYRYIEDNTEYYNSLKNHISKNIKGRICHHRINILNAIYKLLPFDSYIEIGVHNGASMSYVVNDTKKINCIGIDLFEDTSGHYKKKDNIQLKKSLQNINKNNNTNSNIKLIKANSFSNKTKKKIKNLLDSKKVDLLFIDGDHTYEGVKNDFLKYYKFVKKMVLLFSMIMILKKKRINLDIQEL